MNVKLRAPSDWPGASGIGGGGVWGGWGGLAGGVGGVRGGNGELGGSGGWYGGLGGGGEVQQPQLDLQFWPMIDERSHVHVPESSNVAHEAPVMRPESTHGALGGGAPGGGCAGGAGGDRASAVKMI